MCIKLDKVSILDAFPTPICAYLHTFMCHKYQNVYNYKEFERKVNQQPDAPIYE